MAGLDDSGFTVKTLDEILSSIQAVELAQISPSLDVQSTSIVGVMNGIMAQAIYELWQLALALYNGMDPDQATGDELTSLALLTGTQRLAATKTLVTAQVNVNGSFDQAAGAMFASIANSPADIFTNVAEVHNTSSGSDTLDAVFEAVSAGATACNTSSLTVISTPISGWNSITNADAGVTGSEIQTDVQLRIARTSELSASGSATANAIKADILEQLVPPNTVSTTTACTVLNNETDTEDANGVAPHTIEVIALATDATSADDTALAKLIFADKAAGIATQGTSYKTFTDDYGVSQTIYYTRPTPIDIYVDITVTIDTSVTGYGDGTDVAQALVDYAMGTTGVNGAYQPGATVYAYHTSAAAFNVTGVVDVTAFTIGLTTSPGSSVNVPIAVREVGSLETGNITVVVNNI